MKGFRSAERCAAWLFALAAGASVVWTGAAAWGGVDPAGGRALARPVDSGDDLLRLECVVVDAETHTTMCARCRVTDHTGLNRYPYTGSLYHAANKGYFYTGGSFWVEVEPGVVVVRVGQGFEYAELIDTLCMQSDTAIVLELNRRFRMSDLGWYSGDTHVHSNHAGGSYTITPALALLIARAEGLNVVNCLDNEYYFTGGPASCSTSDCIVYMSEEYRSTCLGHAGFLGLQSLVFPLASGWWPMISDLADAVHAQGSALVVSAHPVSSEDFSQIDAWPGTGLARELPMDVISGRIDAFDLASYSNCHPAGIETQLWYRLLNCGFRLPATTGTDAALNRYIDPPPGGYRTYVIIPQGEFDFDSWLENIAAGRTFVSNGPLITHFDIDGLLPGDSLALPAGTHVAMGTLSVRSLYPLGRIEVVQNGTAVRTLQLSGPGALSIDTTFVLSLVESCWVAVRVLGHASGWLTIGDTLFAHTSPVYFTLGGARVARESDALYFAAWVDSLDALGVAEGQWPDTTSKARFFAECDVARAFYEDLAQGQVVDAGREGSGGMPTAIRCEIAPNPFSECTSLTVSVPDAWIGDRLGPATHARGARVAIYDVNGRLVRNLVQEPLPPGTHRLSWDGTDGRGRRLASGIYFARVAAAERTVCHKMIIIR
jgi:hypothetical protein